jgi:8-amino-7-oxononanoate synthase
VTSTTLTAHAPYMPTPTDATPPAEAQTRGESAAGSEPAAASELPNPSASESAAAGASGIGTAPAMPPDVFAKVRGHEREQILRAARDADVLPYFHVLTSPAMPIVEMEGAQRIMLGSNNYLGLTGDERVLAGAQDALHRYGTGLTGSRFLNGTIPLHLELEREIAEWMNAEDAIVFTTGHQANLGTLGTLLAPGDTVIADSGDHASILDGCLLSRAKLRPFRHSRLDKLERALQRAQSDGGGVLVVVDGVFSMEGDIAPLRSICELCERYGARLMVDEAHGAGVLGARGAGTAELLGVESRVDLRMGTFSKSLASCGGFVAGSAEVIEYLRLYSRPFLFTASAVPAALGAALAALRIVRSPEGPPLLERVLANARYLRDGLHELGFAVVSPQLLPADVTPTSPGVAPQADGYPAIVTPVVPVLVGDDWQAALLWKALYDGGVFVNTALHPAVPPGGALLRTSVMATHDTATLDRALDAFARVKREFESEHGPLPGADPQPDQDRA